MMGWKNVKEGYRIGHTVQVTDNGICIGSPYIHDLIVIGLDGTIKKADDGRVNEDLKRYMDEMKADPEKLCSLVQSQDKFTASIPVFTYDGGNIIEKKCEELGWPNVTHDGCMMYENTFSLIKTKVIKWAKESAASLVKYGMERIEQIKIELVEAEGRLKEDKGNLAKLNADHPGLK